MGEVVKPSGTSAGASSANSILIAPVSRFGANINDLLVLNANGYLYPAQLTDTAAASASAMSVSQVTIAQTTAAGGGTNTVVNDVKQSGYVSPLDSSFFFAWPHIASNSGLTIGKFSANAGTILATLVLDSVAPAGISGVNIVPLSNGGLAIVWGTSAGQYFAIVDSVLNLIVAKTSFGVAQTSGPFLHACGLSGGGFAIAYSGSVGAAALLAIYTNTGATTLTPTTIAGSPIDSARAKVAQLSNGNLAVVISSTTAAKAITRSIFTTAGVTVSANAVIDAGTKAVANVPDISVLPNNFAVCCNVAGNTKAYVQSNAGATVGAAFSDAAATTSSDSRITNDGTAFWMSYNKVNTTSGAVVLLPITGGAFAVNNLMPQSTSDAPDIIVSRDYAITAKDGGVNVYVVTQAGFVALSSSFVTGINSFASAVGGTLKLMPDFSFIKFLTNSSQIYGAYRFASISITGIARATIAAGNAGALMSVNVGPSSNLINALPGRPSIAFTHAAASVPGNAGTLLNNSISMKGI